MSNYNVEWEMDHQVAVHIVTATRRDAPTVLRFIRELARDHGMLDSVTASEETVAEILSGGLHCAEVLIAKTGDRSVGFALFYQTFSSFLGRSGIHLEDLYVEAEFRGKGVGDELLRTVALVAASRDCARLEFDVSNANLHAADFYRKRGAIPMYDWTRHRLNESALRALANT